MKKRIYISLIVYLDILLILVLVGYKLYLWNAESDFESVNAYSIKAIKEQDSGSYSFAVLGNIQNSIDIFDKRMVNLINNDEDIRFVISTGDGTMDGAEDKYRILNKSMEHLDVPVIVGAGDSEISDGGDSHFYRHYGPFYFTFSKGDDYFIFMDTTGMTSIDWQKEWLSQTLDVSEGYSHVFVFMNRAPYVLGSEGVFGSGDCCIEDEAYRNYLVKAFSDHGVTAVFSTGANLFDSRSLGGVDYYASGGGGGVLALGEPDSYYHYMKVSVSPEGIACNTVKLNVGGRELQRFFENLWIYIHSLFYINMVNFALMLGILVLAAVQLYRVSSREVDYYEEFSEHEMVPAEDREKLTIAMFTNNYLPFIGGVPISIERLAAGLEKRGHKVFVFAPEYPNAPPDGTDRIIRFKLLTYAKDRDFKFAVANIFSHDFEKEFASRDFDIIHVHHPFWMGKKGLILGEKHGLPVVLTYHTRLEKYAHYFPVFKGVYRNVLSHRTIRRFSQRCDAVIAPTESAKKYLENVGVSRLKLVAPTGIDFTPYERTESRVVEGIARRYRPAGGVLLCTVSRLADEKNIHFLIDALAFIREHSEVPFRCLIIGDGPDREGIREHIEALELESTVLLTGSLPPRDVPAYYMASDIFVFSSMSETQGMVLLEAMAGGCPVVAIRSSGTDDVIKDGFNGFKTEPDIVEWAEKAIILIEDSAVREEMSGNAVKVAAKYSIERMAERIETLYYKLIDGKKG